MSKIYRGDQQPENIRSFDFNELFFQDEQNKPEKEKGFVPDDYGESKSEFIPGGFNFDYEGGLRRDEIMNRSFDEANRITEEAREKAAGIRRQAKDEGFKEGREEGHKEGLEQAKPVIESFKSLTEELSQVRSEYYTQAEKEMIDLVINIAHVVIGLEVDRDPSLVQNVVLKAVEQLRAREKMTVRINPEDAAEAEKVVPALIEMVGDLEKVSFKSDPSITRGGCLIETNIGMIDARLENQLESLRQSMLRALDESEAKKNKERGE